MVFFFIWNFNFWNLNFFFRVPLITLLEAWFKMRLGPQTLNQFYNALLKINNVSNILRWKWHQFHRIQCIYKSYKHVMMWKEKQKRFIFKVMLNLRLNGLFTSAFKNCSEKSQRYFWEEFNWWCSVKHFAYLIRHSGDRSGSIC